MLLLAIAFPSTSWAEPVPVERPAAKRCVALPTDVEGDTGMAASVGLSYEDAAVSMSKALPAVLPCIEGAAPAEPLVLEVTVSCGGVVDRIDVRERADWPEPVATCVSQALLGAEFPAHDRPDGDSFLYPVTYRAP